MSILIAAVFLFLFWDSWHFSVDSSIYHKQESPSCLMSFSLFFYKGLHFCPLFSKRVICTAQTIQSFFILRSCRKHRKQKIPPIDSRACTRIFDHAHKPGSTPFYKVCNLKIAIFVKRCFSILLFKHYSDQNIRGPPKLI